MNFLTENKFINALDRLDKKVIIDYVKKNYEEKKLLDQVFDYIEMGVVITNKSHLILKHNKFMNQFFKKKSFNYVGHPFLEVLEENEVRRKIKGYIQDSNSLKGEEVSFRLSTHQVGIGSLSAFVIAKKGEISNFVYIFFDNTQWHSRYLKRSHEKSISSLKILTAGIAHEIKNPLGSLDLHLQLIERFLSKKSISEKPHLNALVSVFKEELNRLNQIVNDFLLSIRPTKSIRKIANLNEIINETLHLMSLELKAKKIALKLNLNESIPLYKLDKNYIKQALINLVKNSIQAISEVYDEGGLISIATDLEENKIIFSIIDNGCGIDKNNLGEIFEPFYTSKEMGTGLGLTIVYKIIKEHRGEILVESKKNRGTEIKIEFPLMKKNLKLIDLKTK